MNKQFVNLNNRTATKKKYIPLIATLSSCNFTDVSFSLIKNTKCIFDLKGGKESGFKSAKSTETRRAKENVQLFQIKGTSELNTRAVEVLA